MVEHPFPTSLRRNPDDRRPLAERIDAQLSERIEEAIEMAGLELMVELRRAQSRPAPESDRAGDREEFQASARAVLEAIAAAFRAQLAPAEQAALDTAESTGTDERSRRLAGQVHLAKTLPDYWQRLELHRAAYAQAQLSAAARPRGRLRRWLGHPPAG